MTSPAAPTLRPYQGEAIAAVMTARKEGVKRMLVCLSTGAGKTVIFAHLARLARRQVLVLAHREELLGQARDKLQSAVGGAALVAIEQGEQRAPKDAQIVVCSIRSLHEGRLGQVMQGRDVGLIVYDECHHAAADDNLRVLRQLGVFEPDWPGTLLGFTATTGRGDGRGLDQVFERIVYARTLPEMIDDGYLAPLRGFRVATHADLTRVGGGGADFDETELAEAVDIQDRNALVARSIQELARDRRTIAFCVTVAHAGNLARALNAIGVPAGVVHGTMKPEARAEALAAFREGRTQALTNVGVLTEGFDPLTQRVDAGVRAVSRYDWFSLGRHGIGLHFEKTPAELREVLILKRVARGRAWEVTVDGTPRERFSTLDEAVQAVEYEVERRGRTAALSALPGAPWRRRPAPPPAEPPSTAPAGRRAACLADALRLSVWRRVHTRGA